MIREVRKGDRCDPRVAAWYGTAAGDDLHLSVLVTGEIRKGIELARARDPAKARALERWLLAVEDAFGERILPISRAIAHTWGRMSAIHPVPAIDGLLAATAKVHGLTLVTRNTDHVEGLGAALLNPFRNSPGAER